MNFKYSHSWSHWTRPQKFIEQRCVSLHVHCRPCYVVVYNNIVGLYISLNVLDTINGQCPLLGLNAAGKDTRIM